MVSTLSEHPECALLFGGTSVTWTAFGPAHAIVSLALCRLTISSPEVLGKQSEGDTPGGV